MKLLINVLNIILGAAADCGDYDADDGHDNYDDVDNYDYDQDYENWVYLAN